MGSDITCYLDAHLGEKSIPFQHQTLSKKADKPRKYYSQQVSSGGTLHLPSIQEPWREGTACIGMHRLFCVSMSLATDDPKQYVDSIHLTLERLDRTADFNSPWIAKLRDILVQRIAEQEGSTIENVLVSGTLTKSGAVACCIVRVRKVSNPKLNVTEYVRADVALAPPNLPDGDYEMHFEGRSVKVKKAAGHWSPQHFMQVAYESAAVRRVTSCLEV
jgi:hypothetical protein